MADEIEYQANESRYGFLDAAGIRCVEEYMADGPHPSYREFENSLGGMAVRGITDIWRFLEDAVNGTGGFADGSYLIPYSKELTSTGGATKKLENRRAVTDYDQFAEQVCMASWDVIMQYADSIRRTADDERAAMYWENANRKGGDVLSVLEPAFRQARLYLTGWIVTDAPEQMARTAAEEAMLPWRPYSYCVRTKNVPHWILDSDDLLAAVLILEPAPGKSDRNKCDFRVWSRTGWATFAREGKSFALKATGPNGTGVVPVVAVHDHAPEGDNFVGPTDMLSVARLAQTVYNQDSEAREHERKAALFLAMGVKDAKNFDGKEITVGLDSVMLYDGEAAPPAYVSPDLTVLDKLDASRQRKKDAAYEVANMRGVIGAIQTTSGFHAEVELSKSERRISRHAAALERAEKEATEIYLRFFGADNAAVEAANVTINYPRKFTSKPVAEVQAQTDALLAMKPGMDVVRAQFHSLLGSMFPRTDAAQIAEWAGTAAASHAMPDIRTVLDAMTRLNLPVSAKWLASLLGIPAPEGDADAVTIRDADSAALARMNALIGSEEL